MTPPAVDGDDESRLIVRSKRRDRLAFEQLYRRHVGRVHALCLRMTANAHRAEELTQTVFIQLWHKLDLFRGESAFASWLHRLAVNTVLMDMRSTRRRLARVFATDNPGDFEVAPRPRHGGMRLDLEQAIAALPPRARAVFVLHEIEGYTHDEIARAMDLETGTTKAQLHRARKLLQESLR